MCVRKFFKSTQSSTEREKRKNHFCHLKTYPTDYFIFERGARVELEKYRALNYL